MSVYYSDNVVDNTADMPFCYSDNIAAYDRYMFAYYSDNVSCLPRLDKIYTIFDVFPWPYFSRRNPFQYLSTHYSQDKSSSLCNPPSVGGTRYRYYRRSSDDSF